MTVQTAKKVTKINLRIAVKSQAHLQTLTKTPAKFQKDLSKIEGGVAFTRVYTFCDGQSDGQTDRWMDRLTHTKKHGSLNAEGGIITVSATLQTMP